MLSVMGPIVNSLSLKKLDVSSCNIYYLQRNSFAGVRNINTLYLDGNPLISLKVKTVEPLKELQSIRMEPERSVCLPRSFQTAVQYFQNKSVDYYPRIICGLEYWNCINTKDKPETTTEIFQKREEQINYNFIEHILFIIFVCVFVGGALCIIFKYEFPIGKKIASPTVNSETQKSTFCSGSNEVKPWYKMLLFRVSPSYKENKGNGGQ
jgi:hypothetical protein